MKSISFKLFGAAALIAATLTASAQGGETRNVSNFHGIGAAGAFHIHIKVDGKESLKIVSNPDLLKDIETVVEDGTLEIRFRKGFYRENFNEKIDVYVSAKTLSSLSISGAVSMDVEEGTLTGEKVRLVTSGAGKVTSEIKATSFEASTSGASELNLKGKADNVTYILSGSSRVHASDLKADDVKINISGAADAHIYADKTISAHMSGAGKVKYSGNGSIKDYSSSGAGRISKENGE